MPGACLRSTHSCRPPSGLLLEQLLDAIGGAIGDVGGQLRLEQELVRFHRHLQQLARGRITAAAGERVRHGADLVGAGVEVLECRQQHRSEEHTSELQSLMRISYAVFGLKKKQKKNK